MILRIGAKELRSYSLVAPCFLDIIESRSQVTRLLFRSSVWVVFGAPCGPTASMPMDF